jgi:hypothetical protein
MAPFILMFMAWNLDMGKLIADAGEKFVLAS